ncbi:MAG: hypothetical protein Q4F05_04345 [bacterium]|nr:hypothetical protein [bacterium]
MKRVWELSERIAIKSKGDQIKYFLILNIITYCLVAMFLSVIGKVFIYHEPILSIDQLSITLLFLGIVIGLFGGVIFALRRD